MKRAAEHRIEHVRVWSWTSRQGNWRRVTFGFRCGDWRGVLPGKIISAGHWRRLSFRPRPRMVVVRRDVSACFQRSLGPGAVFRRRMRAVQPDRALAAEAGPAGRVAVRTAPGPTAQAYLRAHGLPTADFDSLVFVPDWARRDRPEFCCAPTGRWRRRGRSAAWVGRSPGRG